MGSRGRDFTMASNRNARWSGRGMLNGPCACAMVVSLGLVDSLNRDHLNAMGADEFLIKGKVLLALKAFAVAGKSRAIPAHDCDEGKTANWAANRCEGINLA